MILCNAGKPRPVGGELQSEYKSRTHGKISIQPNVITFVITLAYFCADFVLNLGMLAMDRC
jgi:hypothetical protein